jgi:hypothetical protein
MNNLLDKSISFRTTMTAAFVSAIILLGLFGQAGADSGTPSEPLGPWFSQDRFFNNPARTSRVFTRDVGTEAIRRWPPFEFNTMMTALPYSESPAYADILVDSNENFLPCEGGPFALCFYSGPEGTLPCNTSAWLNDAISECKCIEIPYGVYYVDINAILDVGTYQQTVDYCGSSGVNCPNKNQAPVCGIINANKLFPGADMISAFSFACALENNIGSTSCPEYVYAGCMTAPCYRNGEDSDTVTCLCPNYKGPYQVGQTLDETSQCFLGRKNVWSAAYKIPSAEVDAADGNGSDVTFPTPDGCIPDDPNPAVACPLLPPPPLPDFPTLTGSELCTKACREYTQCTRDDDVQIGFVCDAALCTSQCDDLGLVGQACAGLNPTTCQIDAILSVEAIAECSCCASQICGCEPNTATEQEISEINQAQIDVGITPQCLINGTLCGDPPPVVP